MSRCETNSFIASEMQVFLENNHLDDKDGLLGIVLPKCFLIVYTESYSFNKNMLFAYL